MRLFSFQFTFAAISFLNSKFPVHTFWKDESNFDFGFIDTKGNIFDIQKNKTNIATIIGEYGPQLKRFMKSGNKTVVSLQLSEKEKTIVMKDKKQICSMEWNDTTSDEYINEKGIYLRSNYFGNIFMFNTSSHSVRRCLVCAEEKEELIMHQKFLEDSNIIINNYHEIRILKMLNGVYKEILTYSIPYKKFIKKFKAYRIGNIHFLLFVYENNYVQLYQFNYNHLNKNFKLMHQNNMQFANDIIDVEMIYPYVLVGTKLSVNVYHIRSFEDKFDLTKTIPLFDKVSFYTEMFHINNNLIFNQDLSIPRIQFKLRDAQKKLD
jgi:hypothetical protein